MDLTTLYVLLMAVFALFLTAAWFWVHPRVDAGASRWLVFVLCLLVGCLIIRVSWPLDLELRTFLGHESICKAGPISVLGPAVLVVGLAFGGTFVVIKVPFFLQMGRFLLSLALPLFVANFSIMAFC